MVRNSAGFCDLHTHTAYSDGVLSLDSLIRYARKIGLRAIAVTDHNGFQKKIADRQKEYEGVLEIISGTELNAVYTLPSGRQVQIHIVVLFFDPEGESLRRILLGNSENRDRYLQATLDLLEKEGIEITLAELKDMFPYTNSLGRKHIAECMCRKGCAQSCEEALDNYIGRLGTRKCYLSETDFMPVPDMKECIEAGKEAKGLCILAHPDFYGLNEEELEALVRDFKAAAGEAGGMEVYYKDYSFKRCQELKELADKYHLFYSCGSDYHGQDSGDRLQRFPYSICENMEKIHKKIYTVI